MFRAAVERLITRIYRRRNGLGPGPMSRSVDDLLRREREEVARLQRKADEQSRESFIEVLLRMERERAAR